MKNILKYFVLIGLVASFVSCSEKLEPYNSPDNKLGFSFELREDSMTKYTFVYDKGDVVEHTVEVDLETLGFVVDHDRTISFKQVPAGEGKKDAVAGKHYVPFDDPSVAPKYVVKAGQSKVKIPIVFKRDKSLLEDKYYLKLQIVSNEFFTPSYSEDIEKLIEISDVITRPKYWNGQVVYYFAGDYGDEKYRFMINAAEFKLDEEFFEKHFSVSNSIDMGYTGYLAIYFSNKLREHNAEREKNGLGPLTEKPVNGAPGVKVQFRMNGTPIN